MIQNVNVLTRCAINQLGEHQFNTLQGSNLKRTKKVEAEEQLQDFKSYFAVPEYKTVLVAPISASVSHLLTEKTPVSSSADDEYALFDDEFVRDLVKLKVSSKVHAKRLDVLCASIQSIADTLEVTNTPGSGLLIVKATFDGVTPKEIEALIQERLGSYSLDDIGNAHLMSGWYRLYQVNDEFLLHNIVSQSFCLPDPACDSPLTSSLETVALN